MLIVCALTNGMFLKFDKNVLLEMQVTAKPVDSFLLGGCLLPKMRGFLGAVIAVKM